AGGECSSDGEGERRAFRGGGSVGADRVARGGVAFGQRCACRGGAEHRPVAGGGDRRRDIGALGAPKLVIRGTDRKGLGAVAWGERDRAALAVGRPVSLLAALPIFAGGECSSDGEGERRAFRGGGSVGADRVARGGVAFGQRRVCRGRAEDTAI